jgi:hypothetical protein
MIEIPKARSTDSDSLPCHNDCPLGPLDCPLQKYVDDGTPEYPNYGHNEPGPECPGPGRYRLVDEAAIEELRRNFLLHLKQDRDRTLEFTVNTIRELFDAAGLGRKDEHED